MDIQLTDYKGHTWHLAGAQEGDEGVTLHKISGTTGKLSDHPVPTTQHFPPHLRHLHTRAHHPNTDSQHHPHQRTDH